MLAILSGSLSMATAQNAFMDLQLAGRYTTGIFDEGGTEIAAYDKFTSRVFTTNGSTGNIDVIDFSDPEMPAFLFTIDLSPYGGGANSVACKNGLIVAAVEDTDKVMNGQAVFFDSDGNFLSAVEVGALPDMITFTPNGLTVVVANEGEPNSDYSIDPLGTISIIDVSGDISLLDASNVTTLDFSAYNSTPLAPSIKINGPGSSVAQDLEPEYIAVSANSKFAYVTLQENNALAIVNLQTKAILSLKGLGYKDHSIAGNGLDASDKADSIDIRNWPVKGLYMPDAISYFKTSTGQYLVTANEGDAREYDTFEEINRIKDIVLDSIAFPNYADLQNEDSLGRLNMINTLGDTDGDGDYDELYSYGSRGFSVWSTNGNLVFDSGDDVEQYLASLYPDNFNASSTNQTRKNRSDDKGPEPEAVTTADILKNPYMFLGLERIGGIMMYDMSDPANPELVDYDNNRDFSQDPALDSISDYGPEGLLFIPRTESPNGRNILIASNEISGSLAIYYTDYQCGGNKVSVCYGGTTYCVPVLTGEALLASGGEAGPCDGERYGQFLDETDLAFGVNVYPNPAHEQLNIALNNLTEGEWNIQLFDLTGRMIMMQSISLEANTNSNTQLSLVGVPEGAYTCRVVSPVTGETFTNQLVVIK